MSKYVVPKGLKRAGKALWADIAGSDAYELRPDELRVLEDACREADLIDELALELGKNPMMVSGSMGQPVVHPLVGEIRQHRVTFAALVGKLKLPDSQPVAPRSTQARAAAQSRWGKTG